MPARTVEVEARWLRRFAGWAAVVVGTGALAGVTGAVLTLLLHTVQHLAFGYGGETPFLIGEERVGALRRSAVLIGTGLGTGLAWWLFAKALGRGPNVRRALTDEHLPVGSTSLSALIQIVTVALGASLGREGAPREVGAACGLRLSRWAGLNAHHRQVVLAAGAGAGLAAVYDVPIAGVLFALETLLLSVTLSDVVVTAAVVAVATAVSLLFLPDHPTYSLPVLHTGVGIDLGAVLLGPLAGVGAALFSRLARAAASRAPSGWLLVPGALIAFAFLAALSAWRPEVLGNGRGPAQLVFAGTLALPVAAVLVLLKPIATALCLRGGAVGGLLTPAFSTGSLLGLLAGSAWQHVSATSQPVAFAVLGGTAVLAGTMRAPLTALALGLEFTGAPLTFLLPLTLAVLGSAFTSRRLSGALAPRVDADIES